MGKPKKPERSILLVNKPCRTKIHKRVAVKKIITFNVRELIAVGQQRALICLSQLDA